MPHFRPFGSLGASDNHRRRSAKKLGTTAKHSVSWRETISLVLPCCWPKTNFLRLCVVISFVCTLLSKVVGILPPLLLRYIVDGLSAARYDPTEDSGPLGQLVSGSAASLVIWAALGHSASRFVGTVVSRIKSVAWSRVEMATQRELSLSMFEHVHTLSLAFHMKRNTGELLITMSRGISSISAVVDLFAHTVVPIVFELVLVSAILAKLKSTTILFVVLTSSTAYMAYSLWVSRQRTRLMRETIATSTALYSAATDSVLNYETVKQFGAEDYEVSRYATLYQANVEATQRYDWVMSFVDSGQQLIISVATAASLLLAARGSIQGYLSSGDFVMANTYVGQLFSPVLRLGSIHQRLNRHLTGMEEMIRLRKPVPEVLDIPGARDLEIRRGEIVFEDVCFRYGGDSSGEVKNISLRCPPGKKMAIVGHTGSGKSTLMRLLLRFYDIDSGKILIDGQNVAGVRQRSIRRNVGVVAQDSVLFNDTIGFNISYSRPDASLKDILDAAESAQLLDFILKQPEGLNTLVGERGIRLSGGERQRMAIARCCLMKPAIVLLDEATSALDTTTERQIQRSLRTLCAGQTTIAIAHRLSTVVDADEILVLSDGAVVERGTHAELQRQNGPYRVMWDSQSKAEAEAEGST